MATLVYGMMQSLDGYVDDAAGGLVMPAPDEALFRHFTEHVRRASACLYGRRIYELMRYWDDDRADDTDLERAYGAAWRATPKWVVSGGAPALGPNARRVEGDLAAFVRRLKDEVEGEIDVAGPTLAASLTDAGLIDAYRLYVRPFVLGGGKPYFASGRPPLRLTGVERIGADTIRSTYAP